MIRVVIPTRDRPQGLARALASVAAQDVEEMEIVVVDDGSQTPLAPSAFADPRVRVVRNPHPTGPAAARNLGAGGGAYAWVAFLDDDDEWLAGKLRHCLDASAEYPQAGFLFHRTVFDGDARAGSGRRTLLRDPVRRMLVHQPPHVDSVFVRRAVHEAVRFDESFPAAADLDYMLRLAQATPVVEIDLPLAVKHQDTPSAIVMERRIAGRNRFRQKHAALFAAREVEAFHRMRLGHLHRLSGQRWKALRSFARAGLLRPAEARVWKGAAACVLPESLVRGVARRRTARARARP